MTAPAITLQLPDSIYDYFRDRAAQKQRSVELELMEFVTTAAVDDTLTDDLTDAVRDLVILDDEALWRAARSELPEPSRDRLEVLNLKHQSEGLDPSEQAAREQLLRAYDRVILVRAHAARLLHERGHDVSALGPR